MADKRIDQLTAATTMGDDDLLVLQQNNQAKKLSGATLSDYIYDVVEVSNTQPVESRNKVWIKPSSEDLVLAEQSDVDELKTALTAVEVLSDSVPIPFAIDSSGAIKATDGTIASSNEQSHTDYIDVSIYGSIKYKRLGFTSEPTTGMAFYDSTKTYISGIPSVFQRTKGYVGQLYEAEIPNNAKYVRLSTFTDTSTYGTFEIYGAYKIVNEVNNLDTQVANITSTTEIYNWYDPSAKYAQTNKAGAQRYGMTVNADGTIDSIRSYSYGQIFLVDESKTIPAGTYTITCKITITGDNTPTSRAVDVAIGRTVNYKSIVMKTERGGDTSVAMGDKVGWIKYTETLASPETFAFEILVANDTMKPYTISDLMITEGEQISDYTDVVLTAKDIIARNIGSNMATKNEIFNGEPYTGTYDWQTPVVSYGALFKGKTNVESFAFFTDSHVMGFGDNARNELNMKNYFKRVQKTFNATPCSFLVCGGDLLNNSTTMDEACYRLGYIKGICDHLLDKCKYVIGNHDTNYQGALNGSSENGTGRLTDATIASIMYRDTDTKKAYYSFDGSNSKCYVLDSGIEHSTMLEYDWEQVAWLAGKLAEDDPEHAIIFLHIIITNNAVQTNATNFGTLIQAYNAHTTVTLNSVSYDFTNCTGHVDFWVAGHTHEDSTGTLGGIPYFITTTNSFNSDVPIIDLVLADYDNEEIKLIRVGGTGTDRTISLA